MRIEVEAEITAIGARGDGIATLESGEHLYVPFTAPGDRVRVRLGQPRADGYDGRAVAILAEGPGRTAPACRHFSACGGCALQHLDAGHYAAWKRNLLDQALARRGIVADTVLPLVTVPPGSRRRADFTAIRRKHDVVLGFNARHSHQVIDLAECPVLSPEITALLAPLRALLLDLLKPAETAEAVLCRTDSGLDLLLVTGAALGLKRRERLAAFAEASDLARLSRRHPKSAGAEVLVERRKVRVRFADVVVAVPPGAFLQPSLEGERALQEAVGRAVGDARRIADLFAGCGTFGLPLAAAGRQVHAVEGERGLIEALDRTARDGAGRLGLTTELRDLARRPLQPEELGRYDAVLFDPPRAGAKEQVAALAESRVERVVAISCNPATFARDARILIDGGYRLDWIEPVDQFLWSPHLELAAAFRRVKG